MSTIEPFSESRPFSQACENNKGPILGILRDIYVDTHLVLEIGSGTGQHAVYLAPHLPHLIWQPSDRAENLPGIGAWIQHDQAHNLRSPIELDVNWADWPISSVDAVFSANTLHIMSWPEVEAFFDGIGRLLQVGGLVCIYGPFNYAGAYTGPSNAQFDRWLQSQDPHSGIRNQEDVDALAKAQGLCLEADHGMPANNRLLVWRRQTAALSD